MLKPSRLSHLYRADSEGAGKFLKLLFISVPSCGLVAHSRFDEVVSRDGVKSVDLTF